MATYAPPGQLPYDTKLQLFREAAESGKPIMEFLDEWRRRRPSIPAPELPEMPPSKPHAQRVLEEIFSGVSEQGPPPGTDMFGSFSAGVRGALRGRGRQEAIDRETSGDRFGRELQLFNAKNTVAQRNEALDDQALKIVNMIMTAPAARRSSMSLSDKASEATDLLSGRTDMTPEQKQLLVDRYALGSGASPPIWTGFEKPLSSNEQIAEIKLKALKEGDWPTLNRFGIRDPSQVTVILGEDRVTGRRYVDVISKESQPPDAGNLTPMEEAALRAARSPSTTPEVIWKMILGDASIPLITAYGDLSRIRGELHKIRAQKLAAAQSSRRIGGTQ